MLLQRKRRIKEVFAIDGDKIKFRYGWRPRAVLTSGGLAVR